MSLVIPAPTPETAEPVIVSGPFWPDIDPKKVREEHRIDNTITPPRLRMSLVEAIAETNNALRAWRIAHQDTGTHTLDAVPADEIDSESVLIQKYRRAVGVLTKALLLERQRDYDTTAKGDREIDVMENQIGDHRRDWHGAIADITGRTRSTVGLI